MSSYSIHSEDTVAYTDSLEEAEELAKTMSKQQPKRVITICEDGVPKPIQLWVRGVKQVQIDFP